jgi:hypothetical protein
LDRCIATNGKYVQWSKQWSTELFLTKFRSGDAHPTVGEAISYGVIESRMTNS